MNKAAVAFLIVALGLMAAARATDAGSSPGDAPMTSRPIVLPLKGLLWGVTSVQLGQTVDAVLDEDYRPLYQKASPGVKMQQLDAALHEEKAAFRRSRIDFVGPPTMVDSSVLRGEYTYGNQEALLTFNHRGAVTHFFMMGDRLWKIIEEHRLGMRSPQGVNSDDSIARLSAALGARGRPIPAGPSGAPEVDWRDRVTRLRAIKRSVFDVGFAFESMAVTWAPERRQHP